jgi:hypothetical protein
LEEGDSEGNRKEVFRVLVLGSNSNESFDGNKSLDVVDGKWNSENEEQIS